jgi:hypothetical protein
MNKKTIIQILSGFEIGPVFSTFIDADDLEDSSDKEWLSDRHHPNRDYTKFGKMRKINF